MVCKEELLKGSPTRLATRKLLLGQQQPREDPPTSARILLVMARLLKGQQLPDTQDVLEGHSLAPQEGMQGMLDRVHRSRALYQVLHGRLGSRGDLPAAATPRGRCRLE